MVAPSRTTSPVVARTLVMLLVASMGVGLFWLGSVFVRAASTFTPGNLVALRVGTGGAALTSGATAVFLDEYGPGGGAVVQNIAIPTADSGANQILTLSGSATSEGALHRSVDGAYLTFAGYDAVPGTAAVAGTASTTINRIVGRVDALGMVDTSTQLGSSDFSGSNVRGAASADGSAFWVAGANGLRYVPFGNLNTTATVLLSALVTNVRVPIIAGNQLHVSSGSGSNIGINRVGSGLPTTTGQTVTLVTTPSGNAGNPYASVFLDRDPGVPGIDTLYVADQGTGLRKYSFNGTDWTPRGNVGATLIGLAGRSNGSVVNLWATMGTSAGNVIVTFTDSAAYDANISGSFSSALAMAGTNTVFRGLAFAPGDTAPVITSSPIDQTVASGGAAVLDVVATGTGNLSYQWYRGASGDTSTPVGTNSSRLTSPALFADTQYWVRVSSVAGHDDSAIATITMGLPAPIITGHPQGTSIAPGEAATLNVIASGTGLGYQWYQGTSPDTTSPMPAATAADFTTPPLYATTSYWVRVSNAGGFANSDTATVSVTTPPCTTSPFPLTPISAVQGAAETSPYVGQQVSIRGVVVGDYEGPAPALRGFYLQALPEDDDGDELTSEGIFVFEASNADAVTVGQVVQVTGTVSEFQGQTQLDSPVIESCQATETMEPVNITLPLASSDYLESFEGMLVRFNQTLYVTEHFQLGRFGQVVMSSGGRLPQPTSIAAKGAPAAAQQAANDLNRIIVDDALNNQNADPIAFGRNGSPLSALNTLRGGDTATNMVGVLTYGWAGNAASGNAYRLRTINALGNIVNGGVPTFLPANPRPAAAPAIGGSLKVVGMNVLNYFLTLDIGTQANCGPIGSKQECRGPESDQERTRQQEKLTAALAKLSAGGIDIIGMSELENTQDAGGNDVNPLATIVSQLNTAVGAGTWSYINTGIVGTDTIRVGLIYKTARVTPQGSALVDTDPAHNRPPVAQVFTEIASGEKFSVIVNHFKSKGSCPASGPDSDQNDGQDCWNALRVQQSTALANFATTVIASPQAGGDPDVLLVGDFNSYAKEDPIATLEQHGFTNLVSRFAGNKAYSYVFDGQWGYLDHALASGSLVPQVAGAGDYHINADEPGVLDYNTNFKSAGQIAGLYGADEYRTADHDPVVVGLSLRQVPVGLQDSYNVEAGSTLTVSAALGILANDTGAGLSIFSHTPPAHGTLALNADGSFQYTPDAGFMGDDTFSYTVSSVSPSYNVRLYSTNVGPLAMIDGVTINGGGFGSAVAPVPGATGQFYGLTDRGPNVDGPGGSKIEPLPTFNPSIGRFGFTDGQAELLEVIPLRTADGTPYNGQVNADAGTGEQMFDLNGSPLAPSVNGYDPEGLVAFPDGTFAVSDEYGPFITLFDHAGYQTGRFSPLDGSLPQELRTRVINRGMEGLTLTPDGTTLVGVMESALQNGISESKAKAATPIRIVTRNLVTGELHTYLYLLDNPAANGTSVSEITALSNTQFLVDERDGNSQPGAYKRLFLIDITGATDIGPLSAVGGAVYNGAAGGLLIGGQTIEFLLSDLNTAAAATALSGLGITPVTKSLFLDLGALVTSVDSQGHFFGHDKIEGVAVLNGGATLVISNDSDFGIGGLANSTPPYQLLPKLTPAGVQADGEFLTIDLVRSTADVTITTADTVAPETAIDTAPAALTNATSALFEFSGSDTGSGVASFACSLDGAGFAECVSPTTYGSLSDGTHTILVQATDHAGNTDSTPATFTWTVDTVAPALVMPGHMTLEATGPGGAVAIFAVPATALDAVDGVVPVSCQGGASGSMFPLGMTTVTCAAADGAGNQVSLFFSISVRDTTAPTIDAHANVTVAATSAAGATVAYAVPVTNDLVEGIGAATCSPASGTQFAVGTTPVVCNALDASNNVAIPVTFSVIVTSTSTASELSRFVAFSRDLTWLRAGTTVVSGDVGANQRRLPGHKGDKNGDDGGRGDVTVRFGIAASMQQSTSRVVGDSVLLLPLSSVANVVDNTLSKRLLATVRGQVTTPMAVPFTTLPAFPTVTPGTQNISVAKRQTMTLAAGRYGVVKVHTGGTLVLTGGLYELTTLVLDQSATVKFKAPTQLRIKVELGSRSRAKLILDPSVAGLKASQMVIYVGGRDEDGAAAEVDDDGDNGGRVSVHIGSKNVVQANIYAGTGSIWIKSGTQATGAFIGLHVRIGILARLTLDSAF